MVDEDSQAADDMAEADEAAFADTGLSLETHLAAYTWVETDGKSVDDVAG